MLEGEKFGLEDLMYEVCVEPESLSDEAYDTLKADLGLTEDQYDTSGMLNGVMVHVMTTLGPEESYRINSAVLAEYDQVKNDLKPLISKLKKMGFENIDTDLEVFTDLA